MPTTNKKMIKKTTRKKNKRTVFKFKIIEILIDII